MKETWTIIPSESAYNGGYRYNDPEGAYNHGFADGSWGFDLDYSDDTKASWTPCLLLDNHTATNHHANHHAVTWNTFYAQWDPWTQGLLTDMTGLYQRARVYNRRSGEYGAYQYYGPFDLTVPFAIIFQGWVGITSYKWLPSRPPDYPTDIMNTKVNVEQFESITGRIQSTVFSTHPNTFNLFFPSLTSTDIDNLKSFLLNMDYKRKAFLYYCKETNPDNPFAGVWKFIWVKLINAKINHQRIRGTAHYNLTIELRKTHAAIEDLRTYEAGE